MGEGEENCRETVEQSVPKKTTILFHNQQPIHTNANARM